LKLLLKGLLKLDVDIGKFPDVLGPNGFDANGLFPRGF